jgi:membrane fusion protein (multidrug efflux system)
MNLIQIKMKHYVIGGALFLIVASCSQKGNLGLEELKKKETDLKTQLSEVQSQIFKLDTTKKEIGKLVEVTKLTPQIFKSYINVQGKIDADENVALSTEMPGTVTKINVKTGDEVSQGQVLAETDSRAIQQAISDLQTNTELVNQLYEKQKGLWDQKIGTEVQFLQAKTQKESMEKKMGTLQEQLRMTKIISPINGNVDAVDIKLGQLVAPGMPSIRVINYNNLKVKADLAESYASRVHKGDEVNINFPDMNDSVTAKISHASRAISNLNRTFGIEVILDNKKEYHPNQIANIAINDYKSEKPVISVQVKYIQKDLNGQKFVLTANGNKAARKNITTGKEYNGTIEVKEGLNETDELITSGYDGLNDGDLINYKK